MAVSSLGEALRVGKERLVSGGQGNAFNEARWALCSVMGLDCGSLSLHLQDEISSGDYARYVSMLERRVSGEPFQYILGDVEFGDLVLRVGPGVLIPRPETEELVECCCERLLHAEKICDVCTGSGAIGLSLALRYPGSRVWGTDISEEALVWARKNLSALGLENVTLASGDLFSGIASERDFDLIVSNPPYVSEEEYLELDRVVRDWEPRVALVASEDGLGLLRRIGVESYERLRPGGWLGCEMGDRHGMAMTTWLEALGYEEVSVVKDLSGRDRMVFGRRPRG